MLDADKAWTCVDVLDSSIVSPRGEVNQWDSALVSCDEFSERNPHVKNRSGSIFSLQKPANQVSGTGNFNNITVPSPVIGRKKSPGMMSFHVTNRQTLKRMREANDSLQQELLCHKHMSSLPSSLRSDREGSYVLSTQPEVDINLKTNNVSLPSVDMDLSSTVKENELSPPASSQWNKPSESNVVSPVMKSDRRWRNRKHRIKVSRLRKNTLNNTNKLDRSSMQINNVLKDIDAAENICSPNLNLSPSSPVLVKSREKGLRRKLMTTVKPGDCTDKIEMTDCSKVYSSREVSLHAYCILGTPHQNHVCAELKESQKRKNCDTKGDSLCTDDVKVLNGSESSELSVVECSIEANISDEKECSEIHSKKIINTSPQEIDEVLNEHGHHGRKSENSKTTLLFPKYSDNILCRGESMFLGRNEQEHNHETKREIPDVVTSAEPLIETETSPDISIDNAAVCHHNDVPQVNLYCSE
jgi:hypothetical protein